IADHWRATRDASIWSKATTLREQEAGELTMPFSQDPKKRICCAVYDPQALSGLCSDLVLLGRTAGDVAADALARGDEEKLKQALAVCDIVVSATAKLRESIRDKTDEVRAALMA